MSKAKIVAAIAKAFESVVKWFLRRGHGEAAETINENRRAEDENN